MGEEVGEDEAIETMGAAGVEGDRGESTGGVERVEGVNG